MPAARSILAATQDNSAGIFSAFKAHTEAQRVDTKNTVLTLIRNAYPDYHVTEVDERKVSLREYAATEKASIAIDAEDEAFNATREWHPVGEGIEKKTHPGSLDDDYRFARFQYVWSDKEFLVYYVCWQDIFKAPDQIFYILYPRASSEIDSAGHCPETDALILAAGKWTSQLHNEIFVFDDGRWSKSKELWKSVNGASWSDVILNPDMKKNLIDDVQGFFNNQALYKQFAVPWKRGVILHGVPGNGKTVSIKALMASLYNREDHPIPSLYVKSFDTNCQTEQYAIRSIFTKARSMAPCLLIFEDLDSLVHDDIRSYFLNEVDGLESNDGILMIGSTNHLDKLDPAIAKRPSRFDRKYHFKLPGTEERRGYAQYWRNKLLANDTVEFPEEALDIIAQLTKGFSFAYMKELFVMALLSLVRGGLSTAEDFDLVDSETHSINNEDAAQTPHAPALCTCATICKECNKPLPAAPHAKAKKTIADAKDADKEAEEQKMVLPEVEIPEHLQGNLLLLVIKYQIKVLHADMDNSKRVDPKKAGVGLKGGRKGRRAQCGAC
ncbi:P-loop containing nucleoside triphosphate hydrolase protein [Ampelomyces quisqualis]|uniref:P-loop containing nucleoside triphosphate hydrolase protein n=1 Tax=Ampelomyces quisqualis TaxID=50730 RepID=A0A6A5QFV1_AMPQU|nr:P-loop containing nucleoside triphosphate hydrolase protein [Ampelomyces quisqualis]